MVRLKKTTQKTYKYPVCKKCGGELTWMETVEKHTSMIELTVGGSSGMAVSLGDDVEEFSDGEPVKICCENCGVINPKKDIKGAEDAE